MTALAARRFALGAVLLVCVPSSAFAAVTVTFRDGVSPTTTWAGTRDVQLYDGADRPWKPDVNHDGWPAALDGNPTDLGMLLRFDLSSIPSSAVVTAATLQIQVTNGSIDNFAVRELLKPWVEQEATWRQAANGIPWSQTGAQGTGANPDRNATVLATLTGTPGLRSFPLTAAGVGVVQTWVSSPAANHGVIISEYEATDALEWDDPPELKIDYTDGGTPFSRTIPVTADVLIADGPDPATVNWSGGDLMLRGGAARAAALVSFDVSGIPPWATVQSAALEFQISDPSTAAFPIYEALRPWSENATWNTWDGVSPWSTPGAIGAPDRGTVLLGVVDPDTAASRKLFPFNASGLSLVQDWVSGVRPNLGVLIQDYTQTNQAILREREHPSASERPGLVVTYVEGELVFVPAAPPLQAGGISAPMNIRRQRLDGTAIDSGAPALSVTVSSNSVTARFGTDPATVASWQPTLTVQIPAGEASSAPFFFSDRTVGTPSLTAAASVGTAWNETSAQVQVRPFEFADDFEAGALFPWSYLDDPANSVTTAAEAAHRGGQGLRFVDGRAGSRDGSEGYVRVNAPAGDYYVRFWYRVSPSSSVGNVIFAQIDSSVGLAVLDVWTQYPAGTLQLGGFGDFGGSGTGSWFDPTSSVQPLIDQWHLVELELLGAGTLNASRRSWFDGSELSSRTGLDWSAPELDTFIFLFGAPWQEPREFLGIIDFDDIRIGTTPHASRVNVAPVQPSAQVGDCIETAVSLLDSVRGVPAPAPYAVELLLSGGGTPGAFHTEPTCSTPVSSVTLDPGASSTSVWFQPGAEGTARLTAAHVDFLSLPGDEGALSVTARPPVFISSPGRSLRCGEPWRYRPELTGTAPFRFELGGSGPSGITLDPDSGELAWIPSRSQFGAHRFELRAVGPGGVESHAIELAVQCDALGLRVGSGCSAVAGGSGLLGASLLLLFWTVRIRAARASG